MNPDFQVHQQNLVSFFKMCKQTKHKDT